MKAIGRPITWARKSVLKVGDVFLAPQDKGYWVCMQVQFTHDFNEEAVVVLGAIDVNLTQGAPFVMDDAPGGDSVAIISSPVFRAGDGSPSELVPPIAKRAALPYALLDGDEAVIVFDHHGRPESLGLDKGLIHRGGGSGIPITSWQIGYMRKDEFVPVMTHRDAGYDISKLV